MLNFRNINIVVLLGLILVIALKMHWVFYLILFLVHTGLVVYGSAIISSNFFVKTLCAAPNTDKKVISITFDDGIEPTITPQVLAILKKYTCPATFFCIGHKLENELAQQILQQMKAEGHLIGGHSYSHSNFFDFYGAKRVEEELKQTEKLIEKAINQRPKLFRPPYGVTNPPIAKAIKKLDYYTIGWSVRSLDTVIKDEQQLMARVTKQLKGGDILLLHDHHEHILTFLPLFLEYVLNNGYEVVSLEKLLGISAYTEMKN